LQKSKHIRNRPPIRDLIRPYGEISFYKCFLRAQREGNEVYVGSNIAMAVWDNGVISMQATAGYSCGFSGICLTPDQITGWVKDSLEKIRIPLNRKGFKDEITRPLHEIYHAFATSYESLGTYDENGEFHDFEKIVLEAQRREVQKRLQLTLDFDPQPIQLSFDFG
jgi:hypothetical protein